MTNTEMIFGLELTIAGELSSQDFLAVLALFLVLPLAALLSLSAVLLVSVRNSMTFSYLEKKW